MSRSLPARPNLDHLKKQAKGLLRALQQTAGDSQLADAQHALAREYGFASWPKLKAHVDAFERPATPGAQLAGAWIANLEKSQPHPLNPGHRGATLNVTVDGNTVTMVDVVIDASGSERRGTNTIDVDDAARSFDHGYVLRAAWRGTRVLETVATKDGSIVGQARYEVSVDGTTLTITGDEQVMVFDRSGSIG